MTDRSEETRPPHDTSTRSHSGGCLDHHHAEMPDDEMRLTPHEYAYLQTALAVVVLQTKQQPSSSFSQRAVVPSKRPRVDPGFDGETNTDTTTNTTSSSLIIQDVILAKKHKNNTILPFHVARASHMEMLWQALRREEEDPYHALVHRFCEALLHQKDMTHFIRSHFQVDSFPVWEKVLHNYYYHPHHDNTTTTTTDNHRNSPILQSCSADTTTQAGVSLVRSCLTSLVYQKLHRALLGDMTPPKDDSPHEDRTSTQKEQHVTVSSSTLPEVGQVGVLNESVHLLPLLSYLDEPDGCGNQDTTTVQLYEDDSAHDTTNTAVAIQNLLDHAAATPLEYQFRQQYTTFTSSYGTHLLLQQLLLRERSSSRRPTTTTSSFLYKD